MNNGKFIYWPHRDSNMTSLAEHKNNIKQLLEDINEKIRANLLRERQKLIGFAASEASTNLLEYFLHRRELISSGFTVNHTYFSSGKRAERILDFEFPHKNEIITLLIKQEEFRDILCYGKEKQKQAVEEAIHNLQALKKLIEQELQESL